MVGVVAAGVSHFFLARLDNAPVTIPIAAVAGAPLGAATGLLLRAGARPPLPAPVAGALAGASASRSRPRSGAGSPCGNGRAATMTPLVRVLHIAAACTSLGGLVYARAVCGPPWRAFRRPSATLSSAP